MGSFKSRRKRSEARAETCLSLFCEKRKESSDPKKSSEASFEATIEKPPDRPPSIQFGTPFPALVTRVIT